MTLIIKAGYLVAAITVVACSLNKSGGTNYYFDSFLGSDSNTGVSPEMAFKRLNKIKDLNLRAGDSVLLKSGALFTEQLYISVRGDSGKPVVVGKFGGDAKPYIKGNGSQLQAVYVFNSEHILIRDLEISNKGDVPVDGMTGLLVELKNYGTAKDIIVDNLFIHDVYGILTRDGKGGGNAILLRNLEADDTVSCSSRFDGLIVQNCYIRDCQRNGIMMWGNWERKRWNPSLHVVIRNNILDGVPGDGIVPVACESPLVEYNVMKNCPAALPPSEACDGIWPWSCDNAVVQFNLVSDHKSQVDGYGFDSDWNSTNSLFQYNLSFNNDGGFLLLCNSGGWSREWSFGNEGTIVRYNISINDGLRNYLPENKKEYFSPVIHITGPTRNSLIEKNLFIVLKKPKPEIDKTIVTLDDWSGYADSTFFINNFIFIEEPNLAVNSTKSTHNFFEHNLYVGELKNPAKGFDKYNGNFNKALWYSESDENWDKLINFVKDKTVPLNGKEIKVLEIIGY
jgi:hypothetical protein